FLIELRLHGEKLTSLELDTFIDLHPFAGADQAVEQRLLLSVSGLILLRTLQVFHLEAMLDEKAVLREILLIESSVPQWLGDLKAVVIEFAGRRFVLKRGHFNNHAKGRGTQDLQFTDQLG